MENSRNKPSREAHAKLQATVMDHASPNCTLPQASDIWTRSDEPVEERVGWAVERINHLLSRGGSTKNAQRIVLSYLSDEEIAEVRRLIPYNSRLCAELR